MAKLKLLSRTEARKAEQQQIEAFQQQKQEMEKEVGRTVIEQLAWIVHLSQQDLSHHVALDKWAFIDWFALPVFKSNVVTRIPEVLKAQQGLVADIQAALSTVKGLVYGLADGKVVRVSPEKPQDFTFAVRRDHTGRLSHWYEGDVSTQVFLRTLDLLEKVGCDRLRRCPYQPEGKSVCGRVFVKRKGQRFCTRDHAQAAAYDAWVERGSPRYAKRVKQRVGEKVQVARRPRQKGGKAQ